MPHRLTALPVLPEPLAPLGPLAHGLAAEWDDGLAGLFRALAPDSGATAPLALLAAATPARLAELAADAGYVEAIAAAVARESQRLGAESWYATLPGDRPRAIAYLSPEFGVSDALPQYSGGLGVLAGDHLKAASDLGVPLVAVGLFYRNGYFRQHLTRVGRAARDVRRARSRGAADAPRRRHRRRARRHQRAAARRRCCTPPSGRSTSAACRCTCSTPTCPRTARPSGRSPTGSTAATASTGCARRSCSASAALKALAAVGAEPEVFHSNEGHAGFLGIERIRLLVEEQGLDPAAAIEAVRAAHGVHHPHARAGRHRPVLARPGRALLRARAACRRACRSSCCSTSAREPGGDPAVFNMAALGIRLAARVERRLAPARRGRARRCSPPTSPASRPDEVPIGHITNGVHAETWTGPEFAALYRGRIGDGFGQQMHGYGGAGGVLRRRARRGPRRRPRAAGGRRAPAPAHDVDGARPARRPARVRRRRARPARAHDRLRAARADVQAADADAARPGAARAAAARPRAARADRDRRQGAPRRRRRARR